MVFSTAKQYVRADGDNFASSNTPLPKRRAQPIDSHTTTTRCMNYTELLCAALTPCTLFSREQLSLCTTRVIILDLG